MRGKAGYSYICGSQCLSGQGVRLGVEVFLVPAYTLVEESLCCVLEQDTLSAA